MKELINHTLVESTCRRQVAIVTTEEAWCPASVHRLVVNICGPCCIRHRLTCHGEYKIIQSRNFLYLSLSDISSTALGRFYFLKHYHVIFIKFGILV